MSPPLKNHPRHSRFLATKPTQQHLSMRKRDQIINSPMHDLNSLPPNIIRHFPQLRGTLPMVDNS